MAEGDAQQSPPAAAVDVDGSAATAENGASAATNGTAAVAAECVGGGAFAAPVRSSEELSKEVLRLKSIFDDKEAAEESIVMALKVLRDLGSLPTKVLSETMVGKTVNTIAKGNPHEKVRAEARSLVEDWRKTHRKRKASSGNLGETPDPPLKRQSSLFSEADHLSQPDGSPKSEGASLQKTDSTMSIGESLVGEALTQKPAPHREKVRQKMVEAFGRCEEVEDKADAEADGQAMRDPVVLATEVEEALHHQLGQDPKNQKEYFSQSRAVLFNLKDPKNSFRFKLMVGFYKPEQVPLLSAVDMASDEKNAERAAHKKFAMEAIQSDWNIKHGLGVTEGMFTCGKCKGIKTTYFQMQTRSSDEPMTTFVTCLGCNNRWKFC